MSTVKQYKLQRRIYLIWQDIPNSNGNYKKVKALQEIFFLAGAKTRMIEL
jgi:hypothetical protein